MMDQISFTDAEFNIKKRKTRREKFLLQNGADHIMGIRFDLIVDLHDPEDCCFTG